MDQEVTAMDAVRALMTEAKEGESEDSNTQESSSRKLTQATILVGLAETGDYWHSIDGESFATVRVDDHDEHWPLRAKKFTQWLSRRFYLETGSVPNSQALSDALGVLGGKAQYEGAEHPVYVRIGHLDDKTYIDLCNGDWEALELTRSGWRIVSEPPIKFRRAKGMRPLPRPVAGGNINKLRSFINIANNADWILIVTALAQMLRPNGPYIVLVLNGEQGSAKSTAVKVSRSLIDPNTAELRSQPRDERDLMIAARNGWVVAFDNLSSIPDWLSDAICRLATGGAFGTRELYSDVDEILFDAQRPMILNGITEFATRGDLMDRAIVLILPQIRDEDRKPEAEFWKEFEAARPYILGGLLDAVCSAMAQVDDVHLEKLTRMADFAIFATALERALGWQKGAFMTAYTSNRAGANQSALEASPVAAAVLAMDLSKEWQGKATELLAKLNSQVGEQTTKLRVWPKDAARLSGTLQRLAPNLRAVGIDIQFERQATLRTISIRKVPENSVISVIASSKQHEGGNTGVNTDDADSQNHDATHDDDVSSVIGHERDDTGVERVLRDANDGDDADIHTQSFGSDDCDSEVRI